MKSLSCVWLCDPVDCSPPGFSIHGILQARILEWVAISFSRGSSQPRDRTQVSRIASRRFNLWATRVQPGKKKVAQIYYSLHLPTAPRWDILAIGADSLWMAMITSDTARALNSLLLGYHLQRLKRGKSWLCLNSVCSQRLIFLFYGKRIFSWTHSSSK